MLKKTVAALLLSSALIVQADCVLVDTEIEKALTSPSSSFDDMFGHRSGTVWLKIIATAAEYPTGTEARFLENVFMFKSPTQVVAASEMLTAVDISDLSEGQCIDYILNDGTRLLVIGNLHYAPTRDQVVKLLTQISAREALAKLRSRL